MLDFTAHILPYLTGPGPRHAFYNASVAHRDRLRQVFGRKYPNYLDLNRPGEGPESKEYRRHVYRNGFRTIRRRYIETLGYIPQADDYALVWPKVAETDTDTLERYCGASFSADGSVEAWFWRRGRTLYVDDPNAVLVVLPLTQPLSESEPNAPVALLIPCEGVLMHRRGELAVLDLPAGKGRGRRLLFVDRDSYAIAEYVADTADGNRAQWLVRGMSVDELGNQVFSPARHNCPQMPAVKLGKLEEEVAEVQTTGKGKVSTVETKRTAEGEEYYESTLAPALESICEAQQVASDMAVERNFHVSSKWWEFATKQCPDSQLLESDANKCYGGYRYTRDETGQISGKILCPTCKGYGAKISGSGFDKMVVTPPTATGFDNETRPATLPIPPGGYIERNAQSLEMMTKEYTRLRAEAYATIDMQFLNAEPTTASGESKRRDREAANRGLNVEGAHLCELERLLFSFIGYQRLGAGAAAGLPVVIEPLRFDLQQVEETREELNDAVKNNLPAEYRDPLQKRLISYQTGEDSDEYRRFSLRTQLDPHSDKSDVAKQFLLANARVLLEPGSDALQLVANEVSLSLHFNAILNTVLRQAGAGFWMLDPDTQYEKLMAEAERRTGKLTLPPVDPTTGKPYVGAMPLQPAVDLKNYDQLSN